MKKTVLIVGFSVSVLISPLVLAQTAPEFKASPTALSLLTFPFLDNLEKIATKNSLPVTSVPGTLATPTSPNFNLFSTAPVSAPVSQDATDKIEGAQQLTLPTGTLPILDPQNISPLLDQIVSSFAYKQSVARASRKGRRVKAVAMTSRCSQQRSTFNGQVLVAQGTNVLFRKGYGLLDSASCTSFELKPDSRPLPFLLASATKQFTAVLVLKEIEEGKINLEDHVSLYLRVPNSWHDITIRQLLSHTAGLLDFKRGYLGRGNLPSTTDGILSFIGRINPRPTAGRGFAYSNDGYFVLGKVLEAVSGKSYGALLQEKIFTPLKMNHSGILQAGMHFATSDDTDDDSADEPSSLPSKEGLKAQQKILEENPVALFAVGDVYSTLDDLFRWEVALFYDPTFLRADLAEQMHSLQPNTYFVRPGTSDEPRAGYGFGLHLDRAGDKTITWHTGHLMRHTTITEHIMQNDPNVRGNDVTIIILTNDHKAPVIPLANLIAQQVFQAPSVPAPHGMHLASLKTKVLRGRHRRHATRA